MKIGIIPSIQEQYKNQFEYSCDIRLIELLKKTYKTTDIILLTFNHKINNKYKLIVISGANGNDLINYNKSKKNIIRNKLDNKFFNLSQKHNIAVLGICHGAQFIAEKFKSSFQKKKHLGNHQVQFAKNKKTLIVNSYHTRIITKLGKNLVPKAKAYDKSIELFAHKTKKIIGMVWHPERYKKFKKIDLQILRRLCS